MKTETFKHADNPAVTLTCYRHEPSDELKNAVVRPAILVLPGGGYKMCSDREAEPIALSYMAEGYQAFVLRYTVGDEAIFPRPLADAEWALETILANAKEWSVDAAKVAVIGFSAGGHLAASLGTMGRVRPSALILGYPCITAACSKLLDKPIPGADERVDARTPPTFLFSTQEDAVVPIENSLAFARALNQADVPFEMHIFQKGVHGLSLAKPLTSFGQRRLVDHAFAQWFPMSMDWLHGLWGDFDCADA